MRTCEVSAQSQGQAGTPPPPHPFLKAQASPLTTEKPRQLLDPARSA